ncbi:MAG TPA: transglycosylase SLT domain-containing protein [Bryobacteraceae bacterium]
MTKFPHSEKSIQARWFKVVARAIFASIWSAAILSGQTPARPLARTASAGPPSSAALAALKTGIGAQAAKQPAAAVRELRGVLERVPVLADYAAYSLAAAEFDLGDFKAVLAGLAPVWSNDPPSPLAGDAALLAARAYREIGTPAEGVRVLRQYYAQLAQPAGDALLAGCYRASSDLASAAVYYQRVYYLYPASGEAEQASAMLSELKRALGDLYPPPTSDFLFQRADKLAQAGDYRRARAEYEAMLSSAAGADRDVARVRIGVLDFLAYQTDSAYRYLSGLNVPAPEADAERLYYLLECARRQDRDDLIVDSLKRIDRYRRSPWRLKALYSAGNRYLVENRANDYVPLYRACYEGYPDQPQADYCHWKVTWSTYLRRLPEAAEMLREHLEKYPGSDRSSAALYFLGRLAEASGARDVAKSYYSEIGARFPNHYYADLAERRLADPAVFGARESTEVRAFLNNVVWPVRRPERKFEPTAVTQLRIERARLLESAGLPDLAESELRYGARQEDQPHLLAVRLAHMPGRYDAPHRALRLMKNLVPGYLSIPLEDAPPSFWRLLYPMPWRTQLERNAKLHGLDPYMVAGLIRQESEFNPQAVSPAQAYGLTQIMPATGRMLLKASRRRFRAKILLQPDVNLRLGTTYLRQTYDNYSGRWEQTLASYNAGGSRVQNWQTWADYREPAEFVESIPFSETRNYVFSVMRNASIYRKLYSSGASGMLAADRFAPAVREPAVKASAKTRNFKRNPVVTGKKHGKRHAPRHRAPAKARAKKSRKK